MLPVVFYTGARRWDSLGSMTNLVALGERFGKLIPHLTPVFLNLGTISPAKLKAEAGFFGWVLRLVQQRKARPQEFQALLRRVVQELESMPPRDRLRWLELHSYIQAMVYHERGPSEHGPLLDTIEESVRTDEHRQEVFKMGKTIAQALQEEAGVRTLRTTLIRHLRKRFGELPAATVQTIEAAKDTVQLDHWLDRFATAKSLRDVGIGTSR